MTRKVAVVTGGNRGLGLEVSRRLAELRWTVLLTGRDEDACDRAAEALRESRRDVVARALDVADRKSIDAFAQSIAREHRRIDALVNNAGVSLHGFDARVARETLAVNFFGAMRVTDRLLPYMAEGGRIIMVSSGLGELTALNSQSLRERIAADTLTRGELISLMESFIAEVERGKHEKHGWPSSAYNVSKVGLNALTRVLARELAGDKKNVAPSVTIDSVCPGWVQTRMGGSGAPRSVEQGADGIVRAIVEHDGGSGRFLRDGEIVDW
jgi:NAD(P)-dependent dehydrogenase (short-subunit alcohol dehydrogenase family)